MSSKTKTEDLENMYLGLFKRTFPVFTSDLTYMPFYPPTENIKFNLPFSDNVCCLGDTFSCTFKMMTPKGKQKKLKLRYEAIELSVDIPTNNIVLSATRVSR